jgi:hypothetical protein
MTRPSHPLLQAIANAQFEDASKLLEELCISAKSPSEQPAEILGLIELARVNALVRRAHLMKSLADLDASRLFTAEEGRAGHTWSLEG